MYIIWYLENSKYHNSYLNKRVDIFLNVYVQFKLITRYIIFNNLKIYFVAYRGGELTIK